MMPAAMPSKPPSPSPSPSPSPPPPSSAPAAGGRLFRRAALDRLSTTEDLDQPPTLAGARGRWGLLGAAVLCLGLAVGLLALS